MALMAGVADPTPDMLPALSRTPPPPTPLNPQSASGPTHSGDAAFDAWAEAFYERAIKAGLPADLLDRELAGLTPDPRVAGLDTRQPEFAKPFGDYIKGVVSDDRVAIGQRKRAELAPMLAPI